MCEYYAIAKNWKEKTGHSGSVPQGCGSLKQFWNIVLSYTAKEKSPFCGYPHQAVGC